MPTDCTPQQLEFQGVGRRSVVACFDGGRLSSDREVLLLAEIERRRGILRRFASCFQDHRTAALVEHSVEELESQRVLGWLWPMKISLIMTSCVTTRCWPRWWARWIRPAKIVARSRTGRNGGRVGGGRGVCRSRE